MNLSRRGFLGLILATGVAPAIVRADSLMRICGLRDTLAVNCCHLSSSATSGLFDPIFGRWDYNGDVEEIIRVRIPVAYGLSAYWVGDNPAVWSPPSFEYREFQGKDMAEVSAKVEAYKKERRVRLYY